MKRITVGSTILKIVTVCFFILIIGDEDCNACYEKDAMMVRGIACGFAIIFLSIIDTLRYKRTESIIFDIANQPLLETNEATESVSFASEGKIVSSKTIKSHFAGVECVYYHSILEKLVRSGKNSHWKVIENITEAVDFVVQDSRGTIGVDVRNIDEDNSGVKINYDNTDRKDHKYSEIDTEAVLKHQSFKEKRVRYRKSEYVLRPDKDVFVYGYVEKDKSGLILREHEDHPLIISTKTQKEYIKQFYKGKNLIYISHFLVLIGFLLIVLIPIFWNLFPFGFHLLIAYIGSFFIIVSVIFTMYNRIVLLKNRLLNTLSNIDTELRRRYNLIPRLVASVKIHVKHEKDVHLLLSALRVNDKQGEMSASYTKAHTKLSAMIENYPNLNTSKSFQKLMISLTDTEERIAYSRNFYNTTVSRYNTLIQQIPFNILAKLFSFTTYKFISMEEDKMIK